MNVRRFVLLSTLSVLLLGAILGMSGCAKTSTAPEQATTPAAGSQTDQSQPESATTQGSNVYTPSYKLDGKEIAVIKTNKGTIKVKFFEKDAPIASANFIELSLKKFYDGVKFHRYVPGFVIQGGDPQTKTASSQEVAAADASGQGQYGTGGPGYTIKDEYATNPNKHVDGTLAMARTGAPDSGGSQFYFALGPLPQLDGQYTVFGQTVSGLEVVHKLRAGDVIESITIENASK